MAALANAKTVGAPFSNAIETFSVVYDYALDGAMASPLDVITAEDDVVIVGFHAKVLTACTSGGSAVLDVGISGGDLDLLLDAVAVGALTANSLHIPPHLLTEGTPNTYSPQLPVKLASGEKIVADTTTASFTAGKIEFVFSVMKF